MSRPHDMASHLESQEASYLESQEVESSEKVTGNQHQGVDTWPKVISSVSPLKNLELGSEVLVHPCWI